jgi:hypothetical protein
LYQQSAELQSTFTPAPIHVIPYTHLISLSIMTAESRPKSRFI